MKLKHEDRERYYTSACSKCVHAFTMVILIQYLILGIFESLQCEGLLLHTIPAHIPLTGQVICFVIYHDPVALQAGTACHSPRLRQGTDKVLP